MTRQDIHPLVTLSGAFADDLRLTLSDAAARALESGTLKVSLARQGAQPLVAGVDIAIAATGGNLVVLVGHDNARVRIAEGVRGAFDLRLWRDAQVEIGAGTTSGGTRIICDNARFSCGGDVMFSDSVIVQACDQHAIVDLRSGQILNDAASTTQIGDHVWVGRSAKIMKNVTIGAGSIIGMASVVTRNIAPCSMAAGSPARVMRRDVTWSRAPDRLDRFSRGLVAAHAEWDASRTGQV